MEDARLLSALVALPVSIPRAKYGDGRRLTEVRSEEGLIVENFWLVVFGDDLGRLDPWGAICRCERNDRGKVR